MAHGPRLRTIDQRVIVITGATGEIGAALARRAARKGANLVLVARDEDRLRRIADQGRSEGAVVLSVTADLTDPAQVTRLSEDVARAFGGVDAWVNVTERAEEIRQGCRAAVGALNRRRGGTLVNVGETSATFTAALRRDVRREHLPLNVCLVHTAGVDDGEVIAHSVLSCLKHPQRDVTVGAATKVMSAIDELLPRHWGKPVVHSTRRRRPPGREALRRVARGDADVTKQNLYETVVRHPWTSLALAGAAALFFGSQTANAPTVKGSRVNP